MSKIEKYLIEKGFIFPSSSIYGEIENSWDYSHIGVLLKNNIKNSWINYFVLKRENTLLYEGNILTEKAVWEASGHLSNFEKKLIECKSCNKRFELEEENLDKCIYCSSTSLTEAKSFNLIFKTDKYYLRPETAQNIFVNTKLISMNSKLSLPFAVAQIGKSFRNEVSPGRSIFRTKEFEQLEFEEFVSPLDIEKAIQGQKKQIQEFLSLLGFSPTSTVFQDVTGADLPHYSLYNCDIHYHFEFGLEELWGIASRGDFDISSHQKHSGVKLHLQSKDNTEKIIPHIVEHSVGLNRLMLALITEKVQTCEKRNWEVLSLPIFLSPFKFAVLPLTKAQEEEARKLSKWLQSFAIAINFSSKGSIGKRYREQDEIGTPYCLTVDFESLSWESSSFSFTLRERDSGSQKRIKKEELKNYILNCLDVSKELR